MAGRKAGGGIMLERTRQFQQMEDDISVGRKGAGGEQGKLLKTWVSRQPEAG